MINRIDLIFFGSILLNILLVINSYNIGWSPLKALLDSGSGIICPSGNRAYIHPILGDLQPCSQSLNFYNKSSCPGQGIVCERFPILVPGFQDFCCWENEMTDEEGIVVSDKTPSPSIENESKEMEEKTDLSEVLIPLILRPKIKKVKKVSIAKKLSKGGTFKKTKRTRKTTTTQPPEEESEEEIITTTTQFTTTTMKINKVRRGPKCQNPEDAALIDFGNRLRDCYYQQCPRGYRCEMNKDLRRYICCGKEASLFLPPGLPPLPNPVPIVPQTFRPNNNRNGMPFYNDENDEINSFRRSNIRASPRRHQQKTGENGDTHDNVNNDDIIDKQQLTQDECSENGKICEIDSRHQSSMNPCSTGECPPIINPCNNCYGPLTK
uniref:Uncharacterized protein n=1 Tax=Parastrongyloides trichosuri TaxID=131310 RepID=A0A0N4ZAL2_PARTI